MRLFISLGDAGSAKRASTENPRCLLTFQLPVTCVAVQSALSPAPKLSLTHSPRSQLPTGIALTRHIPSCAPFRAHASVHFLIWRIEDLIHLVKITLDYSNYLSFFDFKWTSMTYKLVNFGSYRDSTPRGNNNEDTNWKAPKIYVHLFLLAKVYPQCPPQLVWHCIICVTPMPCIS